MTRNTIKIEPLEKVEHLLDCCFEVAENIPDDWDVETQELKERLRSIKCQKEILDMKLSNTQARFRQLAKKGRLGQAGAVNWQWATSEAHNLRAVQAVSEVFDEPSGNALSGTADLSPLVQGANLIAEIQDVDHEPQRTDEWVECVECSRWRRLPLEIKANTLPDDWKCIDGAAWRTGLNYNEPPDLEEDVSYLITKLPALTTSPNNHLNSLHRKNEDDKIRDEDDCHQPLNGDYLVRREPVVLKP
jgi:hypothetical protein